MLQTLALSTATEPDQGATVPILIIRDGQPIYIEIDYALYLQLQAAVDQWNTKRQTHTKADAVVRIENDRMHAAIGEDPSSPGLQIELKRRLAQYLQSEAYQTMLASQAILHKEWDQPEEDEAWANL